GGNPPPGDRRRPRRGGRPAARRPRRPRLRASNPAAPHPRGPRGEGRAAAASRGADGAGRPQGDVLGLDALRAGTARRSRRAAGEAGAARRARLEPRRPRPPARAPARAARVRRTLPPVGQLLPPPHRRAGIALRALLPGRPLRRKRAERPRPGTTGADDAHLRARRGELSEQRRARRRARRAGVSRRLPRRAGRSRLADLAARARVAPRPAAFEDLAMRHVIGLVLGTEADWPAAFEQLSTRLGPFEWRGATHELAPERVLNEPFDLRYRPRFGLVLDRVGWWYMLPREWLKKVALMDDVYLLNNPFTFQSMEKHSAYCAMMRLGLKVPDTWLIPHKQPPWNERFPTTAARYNQPFDLSEIGD